MSVYLLAGKSDDAFAALLEDVVSDALNLAEGDTIPVFTAKNSGFKTSVGVTIESEISDEDVLRSGNFWVNTVVSVKHSAVDQHGQGAVSKTDGDALVSAVATLLAADNLESQLSAASSDFHVFTTSITRTGTPREYDNENWTDEFRLRFLACATDLSA